MQERFTYRLVLYTFVVLMICLRPFLAYHLTSKSDFAKDPERVFRMLQRLVKKKEFHPGDAFEATELSRAGATKTLIPLIAVTLLVRRSSWLLSLFGNLILQWKRYTVFLVSPTNRHFLAISRLQI